MTARTVLFIDYENAYRNACRLFFGHAPENAEADPDGHFRPWALGEAICQRHSEAYPNEPPLDLIEVRVYRGQPRRDRDAARFRASNARDQAWRDESDRVQTFRPDLQYADDFDLHSEGPKESSRRADGRREKPGRVIGEKEVDTWLAVDLVRMALTGEFDIAILFSEDRDFRPALRAIRSEFGPQGTPRVDLAGWYDGHDRRLLHLNDHPEPRKYLLPKSTYTDIADTHDYTTAPGKRRRGPRKRRRNPQRENRRAADR